MRNKEQGFAALFLTLLVLAIILILGASITALTVGEQKISANVARANQAYFASESGIEDALLRLKQSKNWSSPYTFTVGNSSATVTISDEIGGSQTITSQGDFQNRIRKTQVVYQITTEEVAFFYGVQVGDLGLEIDSNTKVHGNIFSNGPIIGASNAQIYGDAISAGPSGRIEGIDVMSLEGGGSAWAKHCEGSDIDEDLHYTSQNNCDAGGYIYHEPGDFTQSQNLPITEEQIAGWKSDALAGGTISGYVLEGNDEDSLGPIKVDGDMTLDSNAILTMTGTIWVTGDLDLNSNVMLELDPGYGSFSGIIVVDGQISIDSNVTFCGSEGIKKSQECNPSIGSYLMLLSTNNSSDPANPAIYTTSNTETAILYASDGFIRLSSNSSLREATGYGIYMDSNAEVTYETGLADTNFSSGPGGSWQVTSWREVE
ncbi:PilX N-terminal domain-containing pilus assembly protein [Patescibacteria group bacterium]